MRAKNTEKQKIALWIFGVYILSFLCYVPELLHRRGAALAAGWLLAKYLFVCVPALAAAFFLLCGRGAKRWLARMFSGKITVRHIAVWAVFAAAGILSALVWSLAAKTDVFQTAHPSAAALFVGCAYLFMTAFVEEIAWRGFLLERVFACQKGMGGVLLTGAVWTAWHMPMWIIRNSSSGGQLAYLCVWTILVSVVLGTAYCQCRNIVFTAALHAAFNLCYLAPIQCNIVVLAALIGIGLLRARPGHKRPGG